MDVGERGWRTTDGAGGLGGYEWTRVVSVSVDNLQADVDAGVVVRHAKEIAASV
jgi:hypothetical protein